MKLRVAIFAILLLISAPSMAADPGTFDLIIYANEDYRLNLTHTANGLPINLTGYNFRLQAKKPNASVVFVTFSSAVANAGAGQTSHWLSRNATRANSNISGVYDLMQTAPDGSVSYLMKGSIKFMETVTR